MRDMPQPDHETRSLMRARLLARAGVTEDRLSGVSIAALRRTEWSAEFESLMRNRMVQGAFRYGRLGAKGKPHYDRLMEIRRRLERYEDTGNLECLVDAANVALLEFVEGRHPDRHFASVDDGEHAGVSG